jgi:SAM-dependent methyltransferase
MVHALQEIRRILVPGGILIDLRPVADHWLVEVATAQDSWEVGRVQDLPAGLADDATAAEALAHMSQAGWFAPEQTKIFDFLYYWDTPEEMQAYISEQWVDFIALPAEVLTKIQAIWANSATGSRVRVRLKMLIAMWQKRPVN